MTHNAISLATFGAVLIVAGALLLAGQHGWAVTVLAFGAGFHLGRASVLG